jgi:hypothetical protein
VATVHLYQDEKEVTARTLVLKRHVNIESIESWWRAAKRALTGKVIPLEYDSVEVDPAYIRFVCGEGIIVFVDRKRSML